MNNFKKSAYFKRALEEAARNGKADRECDAFINTALDYAYRNFNLNGSLHENSKAWNIALAEYFN